MMRHVPEEKVKHGYLQRGHIEATKVVSDPSSFACDGRFDGPHRSDFQALVHCWTVVSQGPPLLVNF